MTVGVAGGAVRARDDAGPEALERRAVGIWLLCVSALLFCMVVLGGVTRLTESGLSITEWRPITGVLPPMSDSDWQDAFDKYRQIPEYQQINKGMSLEAFKRIFYYEWAHRLLGRLIGIAFLVPFLVFLVRRRIDRALAWRLGGLFVLGGLQGAMGWYMVMSGLTERTDVSQYRLTAHLGLAFLIQAAILWTALDQFRAPRLAADPAGSRRLGGWALALAALCYVQILAGGFVAGIDAGFVYNTWPLMDGDVVPAGYFFVEPWWRNLFETHATVQFNHRVLAYAVATGALLLFLGARRAALGPRARMAVGILLAAILAQVGLGIWTLLEVVPVPLGAAHQGGAFLVFSLALWTAHALRRAA